MSWPSCFAEWAEQGRPVAFWSIYQQLRHSFHNAERSNRVADDSVQSALLKVAEQKGRVHFPVYPAFLNWLKLVAWRNALAILNKEDDLAPYETGPPEADKGPGSADRLSLEEELAALRACMETLDESERQIVQWRHFDGLNLEEIAERLDVVVATAHNRVRRARVSLRRCLLDQGLS